MFSDLFPFCPESESSENTGRQTHSSCFKQACGPVSGLHPETTHSVHDVTMKGEAKEKNECMAQPLRLL